MKLWILAFRNMGRNLRRTLSTAVAISAGFIGLVLLSAYIYRTKMGLTTSTVYINHKGHLALFKKEGLEKFATKPAKYLLSAEDQNKIQGILDAHTEQIEFTGKYLSGTGLVSNGKKSIPFMGLGLEPQTYSKIMHHADLQKWTPDWIFPETIATSDELIKNPQLVSVTALMGELLGKELPFSQYQGEDRSLQLAAKSYFSDLNANNVELGLRHTTGIALAEDSSLLGSLATFQDLYATDGIQYWALFLNPGVSVTSFRETLAQEFRQAGLDLDIEAYDGEIWGAYYNGSMSFLYVMGSFFIFLICGAVLLSIVNSTTLGIIERMKEIGTLRAIGFRPKHIQSLFWRENLLVGLMSVACGQLIAEVISGGVNWAHFQFEPPGTQGKIQFMLATNWKICLIMAVFLLILNVATTLLVVRKITKPQVIKLLTESGA